MAVLIKGMEMPGTCIQCPCLDDEYWICKASVENDEPSSNCRPSWCPLVYVQDKLLEENI